MRLRAHHKLFLSYVLLVAAVVVSLSIGVEVALREPLLRQAGEELQRELDLGRDIFDREPSADPDSMARHLGRLTGHRVTVIALDGTVLGDSGVDEERVADLENHASRPEFQDALATERASAIRRSTSVDRDMLYAAVRTMQGPVLRFAIGIETVDAAVARVRRQILMVGGIALFLSAIFSLAFSVAVTRRLRRMKDIATSMAEGDLRARVHIFRGDELGELGAALDTLASELQRRMTQLEGEREEMKALIDSMAEGVLAMAPDGTLRRANPAAREIFGLGTDYIGIPAVAVNRRKSFLALVEQALDGVDISATELMYDGRHLLATAQPLPRGGAVLVFLDTTELRRLEGVRRDFIANASHELKTPLTVIRGHAETLLDEDLPEDLRKQFTGSLLGNANRLQSILEDLLDLSRIESGGWMINAEPIRLEEVVDQVWESFAREASERSIDFGKKVDSTASTLEADPMAVRQIFTNLFSNALRYTPEGGRIEVMAREAVPGMIEVQVRDTGSGIPEPHLDRIFERFYRVEPARSRAGGGTGLGLAIVRHLIERHGGAVTAESEFGEGTTIRFTLPIRQPAPTPDDSGTD